MQRSYHRKLLVPASVLVLISLVCLTGLFAWAKSADKHTAKPRTLSGTVTLPIPIPAGTPKFSYAILYIDSVGTYATNLLPLRFELDTTKLSNGKHIVKTVMFDEVGMVAELPSFPIIVANHATRPVVHQSQPDQSLPPQRRPKLEAPPVPTAASFSDTFALSFSLDGKPMQLSGAPYLEDGRAMAPLRSLVEAAGGTLDWYNNVGATRIQSHLIVFRLNSDTAEIDGKFTAISRPVTKKDSRVFAPVSIWREVFANDVQYQESTRTVMLLRSSSYDMASSRE